ncbi:MAG TPA: N-acetylmuramoyl-L-alanine amidase [Candidatus Binatia bacterium]|nr:N-acetylmuramoyl-L-alanine amidase [Candidatus Binatia bacterium]
MPGIDETKSRLMRGVVEDNINVLHNVRVTQFRRRRTRHWSWIFAGLATAGTIYAVLLLFLLPAAKAPAVSDAPAARDVPAWKIEGDPETETALLHPRPIDRAAIPLSIKTIVIDAGHGGEPGTTAESGITEKEITLDVALRLRRLLKNAPFRVLLTREKDHWMSLEKRVGFANENKADLFLSIHANWMEPHSIRALETYYVGPTDDPAALKLATRENRESGYSLADYKQILEKIYVDVRRDESRALAKTMQSQMFRTLKSSNPALENRGVRTAPFAVLIGTQMPAILVEIACLSNQQEAELLTKEDYRENIAMALARGIRSYAGSLQTAKRKGS